MLKLLSSSGGFQKIRLTENAHESCKRQALFTLLGQEFFPGKQFLTLSGKDNFTLYGNQFFTLCIEKYLAPEDTFITCIFAEEEKGKLIQKGVYCKMARGEMVRFMAENRIEEPEEMKSFDRLEYHFREELSTEREYVFLR